MGPFIRIHSSFQLTWMQSHDASCDSMNHNTHLAIWLTTGKSRAPPEAMTLCSWPAGNMGTLKKPHPCEVDLQEDWAPSETITLSSRPAGSLGTLQKPQCCQVDLLEDSAPPEARILCIWSVGRLGTTKIHSSLQLICWKSEPHQKPHPSWPAERLDTPRRHDPLLLKDWAPPEARILCSWPAGKLGTTRTHDPLLLKDWAPPVASILCSWPVGRQDLTRSHSPVQLTGWKTGHPPEARTRAVNLLDN